MNSFLLVVVSILAAFVSAGFVGIAVAEIGIRFGTWWLFSTFILGVAAVSWLAATVLILALQVPV